jgi:hypothetical protein
LLTTLLPLTLVCLKLLVLPWLYLGATALTLVGVFGISLALPVVLDVGCAPGELGLEVGAAHLLGALTQDLFPL